MMTSLEFQSKNEDIVLKIHRTTCYCRGATPIKTTVCLRRKYYVVERVWSYEQQLHNDKDEHTTTCTNTCLALLFGGN